jgi:chromosomal replication initiation ATPase DnaA
LIIVLALALLAISASAVAGTNPTPADQAAAAKQCSTERTAMQVPAFKLLYGTNANKSNAFGKCVSTRAQQNAKNQTNAAAQCRTERAGDPAAFATKYGTGKKHANAFGNCVSGKAKAAAAQQVQATDNAAKACWTERKADLAAFKAKYGTNANKSNAFGKCVSGKVKHPAP